MLVGAVMLPMQRLTHGEMGKNMAGANFGHLEVSNIHEVMQRIFTQPGNAFAILLFGFGVAGLYLVLRAGERENILPFWFATALFFAFLGSGFRNGNTNHFLELGFVCAVLSTIALGFLKEHWAESRAMAPVVLGLLFILLLPALDIVRWRMTNEKEEDLRAAVPLVTGQRVLTDLPFLAARSSNAEGLDFISLTFASFAKHWSDVTIRQQLGARQFSTVLLAWPLEDPRWKTTRYPRLSADVRQSIEGNYGLCGTVAGVFVYGPRVDGASPTCLVLKP
jgi:hypothetical protein